uniref:Uncharacterized protein n=1 Tax=Arundo donax TaxID=35708 RepID=A0A0A9CQ80_ARUDO
MTPVRDSIQNNHYTRPAASKKRRRPTDIVRLSVKITESSVSRIEEQSTKSSYM